MTCRIAFEWSSVFKCTELPQSHLIRAYLIIHTSNPDQSLNFLCQSHSSMSFINAGVMPGQEFTAVIHATSPLVSQSQPIMKLLQVVSKSKYCSQVHQLFPGIRENVCRVVRAVDHSTLILYRSSSCGTVRSRPLTGASGRPCQCPL